LHDLSLLRLVHLRCEAEHLWEETQKGISEGSAQGIRTRRVQGVQTTVWSTMNKWKLAGRGKISRKGVRGLR